MLTESILLTTLLLTPPPTDVAPPDFADQLDSVDVTVSDSDVVVLAFDSDGEAIGSLALWVDGDGRTWITADYSDGSAVLIIDPFTESVTREGDLPDDVLAERADAILIAAEDPAQPAAKKHKWSTCAGKTVLAGFGCWVGGPLGCVYGAVKASCACVPKLVKEFDPYECPWGL